MNKKNLPIGIFDSGLGGLTVLKKLQQTFPHESFIYIGDTAHVPYGNKSKKAIIHYSESISKYLINQQVKLIVIACNTASAVALQPLNMRFNIPIIDVITPIKHTILQQKTITKVGVIGTYNTIQSNAYYNTLKAINQNIQVVQRACPLFVPIIEEGLQNDAIAHLAIKKYLAIFCNDNIELLILGCTHYPLIQQTLQENIASNIQIVDSATATAIYLAQYLKKKDLLCIKKTQQDRILITDKSKNFQELALRILNKKTLDIETLKITS